jgi:3-deoxy-D-arabino-heptulosonate 7-phosphate (DAHP) synthase class II
LADTTQQSRAETDALLCTHLKVASLTEARRVSRPSQQEKSEEGSRYRKLASKVDESLRFMKAIGVDTDSATFKQAQFFTAHECLLLPYEQALTRMDSTTGEPHAGTRYTRLKGSRTDRELRACVPNPRPLVRLLCPHAVGWREDTAAGWRARGVHTR